jgi:outer membrane protein TolC
MERVADSLMRLWPVLGLVATLTGCMSSDAHRRKADDAVAGIVDEYQQTALGRNESFTIEAPADSLRRRLMIEQELPGHVPGPGTNELFASTTGPLTVTLRDALQISARHNLDYQSEKERVFSVALALDLTRSDYQNSYSALLSTLLSGEGSGSDARQKSDSSAVVGISRRLQSGATLSGKLGVDLVKLLTMDKSSTFGLFADATISIPLLRGAGKDIAREPLTQAERNVIYAIWQFERYKKSFAVEVVSSYLQILELAKQIENAETSYQRIMKTRERVEALAEAGRTPETQVFQAFQDELSARNRVVATSQDFEQRMDAFKVTLGIPVDARIAFDPAELISLSRSTMAALADEPMLDPEGMAQLTRDYVLTALTNRLDLMTVEDRFEDARRQLHISEDSLDPDMRLQLSASTRQTDVSRGDGDSEVRFSDGAYSALLDLDLPWDRTRERAAFRQSLIALQAARRDIEQREDAVKREVRGAVRKMAELKETYLIQRQAVSLAERRVESTELLLKAGRTEIRDVLESQESLVIAQDSLGSAVVNYHIATLELQRSLELLSVDETGVWR